MFTPTSIMVPGRCFSIRLSRATNLKVPVAQSQIVEADAVVKRDI